MAVYVDESIWPYRGQLYCHMSTDGNIQELHDMAKKIGLKRSWFQEHRRVDHYDVSPNKRKLAIANGAIEVDSRFTVENCHNGVRE